MFEPGVVTLVVGTAGVTVYAGAVELTMAESARSDENGVQVFMRKPSSEAEHLRLDEETRAAKSCDLLTIRRR